MKKRTYIKPELNIHLVQLQSMLAFSKFDEIASSSDGLTKESGDWDIWGNGSDSDYEDDYDY
ncbi:MAG: hypothetical protein E7105_04855 [Prevotella sp.]|nr:hypothetical protein [Prevotella sp.]